MELADGTLMTTSYYFPSPASGMRIIRKNDELDTGSKSNLFKSAEGGATIDEIVAALDWQAHTARGAMSGALKKKLGLTITSEKIEGRGRAYRITDA